MKMWQSPNLLDISANTGLEYRCFFNNPSDSWIYEGDGANDEMCMLIGLYTGGNGTIWGFPGMDFPGNICTVP